MYPFDCICPTKEVEAHTWLRWQTVKTQMKYHIFATIDCGIFYNVRERNQKKCFLKDDDPETHIRRQRSAIALRVISIVLKIIDGLGLIRLFFWFQERCFWASAVVHVVLVQWVNWMARSSQQNIFKFPTYSRDMAGRKGRGSEISWQRKVI